MTSKLKTSKTKLTSSDRNIQNALKKFPRIVQEKARVHKEKEKIAKAFRQVTSKLLQEADQQATRQDCIRHYSEIQESDDSHYPGSDELLSIGSPFGKTFGFKRLGIHHEVLKPGRRTSWPHAEKTEEEFVYVIEGRPQVWIDGDVFDLKPGDGVGFVPGTGVSHTFINNTKSDVRLLVVGDTNRDDNKCIYPLHHERNEAIKTKGFLWIDAPKRALGPHDGMPDRVKVKSAKSASRPSKARRST